MRKNVKLWEDISFASRGLCDEKLSPGEVNSGEIGAPTVSLDSFDEAVLLVALNLQSTPRLMQSWHGGTPEHFNLLA